MKTQRALLTLAIALNGLACSSNAGPEVSFTQDERRAGAAAKADGTDPEAGVSLTLDEPFVDDGGLEVSVRLPRAFEERALFLDGEVLVEGKTVGGRVRINTLDMDDGVHALSLVVLADGEEETATVEFEVANPDVRVHGYEAPRLLVPGEVAEFGIEAEGAEHVELDFSSLDPDFDPDALEVEREGDEWTVRYLVPEGPEGHFPVPVRAFDAYGGVLVLDDLRPFRLAAPLLPLESEQAVRSLHALSEEDGEGAAEILDADAELRLAGGETETLTAVLGGDLEGATLEIGLDGHGGHLQIPVDGFEKEGDLVFANIDLTLPYGVERAIDPRFLTMRLRDRYGYTSQRWIIDSYLTPRDAGRVTVTLGWSTAHDLDLQVTEPGGTLSDRQHDPSAAGARFPVDANRRCGDRKGREYAVWQNPPNGRYEVRVSNHTSCGDSRPSAEWVHVAGCGHDERLIMPPAFGGQPMSFVVACTDMSVSGRARYRRTAASGATVIEDLDGVPYRILDRNNSVVTRGVVRAGGRYEAHFPRPAANLEPYRIDFYTDTTGVRVSPLGTSNIHTHVAFAWNPLSDRRYQRDVMIDLNQSGAFHILRTVQRGHRWYTAQSLRMSRTTVEWTGGQDPVPTSHFKPATGRLYLLGRAQDPDQFDDSVILHELAHRASHLFSSTKVQGGTHSRTGRTRPSTAWNEGVAYYIGQSTLGSRRATDRTGAGARIFDMDSLTGVPLGTSDGTDSGQLSEGVVTAFLWDLRDGIDAAQSDRISGTHRAVMASWRGLRKAANIKKRGDTARADLGDFVDDYTCGQSSGGRRDVDNLLDNRFSLGWVQSYCKP